MSADSVLQLGDRKEIDPVTIQDFPIPPSDNALKKPVQRHAKGGFGKILTFVDSKEYTIYKRELQFFLHRFAPVLQKNALNLQQWLDKGYGLKAVIVFKLNHSTIYTKKGTIKRWDVTNRLKGLLDGLTTVLAIDDSNYFEVEVKKESALDGLKESCSIVITPVEIKNPLERWAKG